MDLLIAFREYLDLRDRCEVVSTRIATREAPYEDGAVVPAGDWRPLTPAGSAPARLAVEAKQCLHHGQTQQFRATEPRLPTRQPAQSARSSSILTWSAVTRVFRSLVTN